jgi:hypothetical protein
MDELLISWDVTDIADAHIEHLLEEGSGFEGTKEEAESRAHHDSDIYEFAWDNLLEDLTEWMNGRSDWHAEAVGLGWRNSSGQKDFEAVDGKALLAAVLPKTGEFRLEGKTGEDEELVLRVWHHDSPVNPDTITITEEE